MLLGGGPRYMVVTNKNYYQTLLNELSEVRTTWTSLIEKDVTRSFPEHWYYSTHQAEKKALNSQSQSDVSQNENSSTSSTAVTPPGLIALRRILTAYSWHNPDGKFIYLFIYY